MAKAVAIKYPVGFRGIVKTTTNEARQEELFLPTDNRLLAVNAAGDAEIGTLVCDLDDQNQIDPDRVARLQSAFRVIRYPFGEDNGAIAFQLGPSGLGDTKGYFVDRKTGGLGEQMFILGGKIAVAQGSWLEGGPFDCGTGECRHKRGTDDDGNPISSLHLSTKALFRKDDSLDGPLKFEAAVAPPNKDLDTRIDCHISYDTAANQWYIWTTSALEPVEPDRPKPFDPDKPRGFVDVFEDPTRPPVPTGGKTGGGQTGSGGGRPDVATGDKKIGTGSLTGDVFRIFAALGAIAAPAFVTRAQNYGADQVDTGLFAPPGPNSKKKAANAPVSVVASGFAAQGGQIAGAGGSGNPTSTGAKGDPWVYNQYPRGWNRAGSTTSKYQGGTANGGIVFHPPETDLRDATMAPSNVTLSTQYVLVAPNVYFGCGIPQLVNGAIKDGFSWGVDSSTGDLVFRSHSSSGAPSEAVRFTKTAQDIQWTSGTGFYGIFAHNNSANHTYTFPNKDGTVAMTSDIGTGVSALATTYSSGTQTGIVTDASIIGTSVSGSFTSAANYFTAGKTLRLTLRGYYTTTAVPGNLTVKVLLGAATVLQTGAVALTGGVTQRMWEMTAILTCKTTGVGGSGIGQGFFDFLTAGTGNKTTWAMIRTSDFGIDTTNSNLCDVVVTFDTAGNTIVCTNAVLEGIN